MVWHFFKSANPMVIKIFGYQHCNDQKISITVNNEGGQGGEGCHMFLERPFQRLSKRHDTPLFMATEKKLVPIK
jgi:hypothetical protein